MIYIIAIVHGVFWLELIPRPYSGILLLEMPLIFLVSGYTYALSVKDKLKHLSPLAYFNYAGARLTRILIPYFAYAFVCACLFIVMEKPDGIINVFAAWMNPLTLGRGYSTGMLSWHLWFVPPFLIITLLLPFIARNALDKVPIWLTTITIAILITISNAYLGDVITMSVFYIFWAYVGYRLARKRVLPNKVLLGIGALSAVILLLSVFVLNADIDMQTNKFPPNWLFLLFSIIWVCVLILLSRLVSSDHYEPLHDSILMKPFIACGYSIYLWQGLGYSAAKFLNVNTPLTWMAAIILTVILGVLFSPLEKIRFKITPPKERQSIEENPR